MPMTVSQVITFKCSTLAEYTELVARVTAWEALQERPVKSWKKDQGKLSVDVTTNAYPFLFGSVL